MSAVFMTATGTKNWSKYSVTIFQEPAIDDDYRYGYELADKTTGKLLERRGYFYSPHAAWLFLWQKRFHELEYNPPAGQLIRPPTQPKEQTSCQQTDLPL